MKNEPAFPVIAAKEYEFTGMTLLDYVAIQAMQAIITGIEHYALPNSKNDSYADLVAQKAYSHAKAILKEKARIESENEIT